MRQQKTCILLLGTEIKETSCLVSYQSVIILINSEKTPPLLWVDFIDADGVLATPAWKSRSCHGSVKFAMSAIGWKSDNGSEF
jgi:hypothetical protein